MSNDHYDRTNVDELNAEIDRINGERAALLRLMHSYKDQVVRDGKVIAAARRAVYVLNSSEDDILISGTIEGLENALSEWIDLP